MQMPAKTINRWPGEAAAARALINELSWPEAKQMMVLVARTWDEMADHLERQMEEQKKSSNDCSGLFRNWTKEHGAIFLTGTTSTTAAQYRDTAAEIRQMADRAVSADIRAQLLTLVEQFERLAERAEAKTARH
jgi:hypothetical protein